MSIRSIGRAFEEVDDRPVPGLGGTSRVNGISEGDMRFSSGEREDDLAVVGRWYGCRCECCRD